MKLTKNTALTLITGSILSGFMGFASPSQAQSVEFQCGADYQNIPTTYVETPGGVVEIFKWKSTYFQGAYTPVQRCLEVTQRMNQFQPDYLVTGRVNNYNVICAGMSCDRNGRNILLTLRPDQNPSQVLQEIDNTRDGAGGPSMQFNGSSNILNNFKRSNLSRTSDGSLALNLTRHIQTAPKLQNNFSQNLTTNNNNENKTDVTSPSESPTPSVSPVSPIPPASPAPFSPTPTVTPTPSVSPVPTVTPTPLPRRAW
jgi:hypothetical protein